MLDLERIFNTLEAPTRVSNGASYSAYPIPNIESHRLAKGTDGAPSLLVSVTDSGQVRPVPVVLEHLRVQHDVDCVISLLDGTTARGRFTVISCTDADRTLHAYFLRVASAIVMSLGATPSVLAVSQLISGLTELFHAMAESPRKSVQGLWAELFLIARSREPSVLIRAWHVNREDRYDFNAASQRVEVKSASGRVRLHHFSLEQLNPPAGTSVLIASVFVEPAGAGTSLGELADRVRDRVGNSPELLLRVDRTVTLTLGCNWRQALEERFDWELAQGSVEFFESWAIPAVGPGVPAGVSEVRFRSDLTGRPTADRNRCRSAGGLFRALSGR
jgi:hypothetical protein